MATYLIGNIKGPKGADGVSPKAKVEQVSNGAMITITDTTGTTSALVRNGVDGDGNNIDLTPYATWAGLDTAINEVKNDYATKEDVETAVAGVNVPVTSVNGMVGEVVIPAPDLTPYATQTWVESKNYLETAPVSSVNGETGEVVLSAADIGALPADTVIPTKTSELTNDSNYVSASTLTASLATKQDALTAGSNITIENNVISATGGSSFSGDYDDLTNKPDLSVYAESADLATVATTGDYDDLTNKPTIPTVPTTVSSFTNDAGYITSSDLPANELPAITSGDAGKVLTVNSGETGVEWTTPTSGGSTYTAGTGIEIDSNNVIKPIHQPGIFDLFWTNNNTASLNGFFDCKFAKDLDWDGFKNALREGYIVNTYNSGSKDYLSGYAHKLDYNVFNLSSTKFAVVNLDDSPTNNPAGIGVIHYPRGSHIYYFNGNILYVWTTMAKFVDWLLIRNDSGQAVKLGDYIRNKQDALPALTDNAGKVLTVNSGATGLEWTTPASGGGSSYTDADVYNAIQNRFGMARSEGGLSFNNIGGTSGTDGTATLDTQDDFGQLEGIRISQALTDEPYLDYTAHYDDGTYYIANYEGTDYRISQSYNSDTDVTTLTINYPTAVFSGAIDVKGYYSGGTSYNPLSSNYYDYDAIYNEMQNRGMGGGSFTPTGNGLIAWAGSEASRVLGAEESTSTSEVTLYESEVTFDASGNIINGALSNDIAHALWNGEYNWKAMLDVGWAGWCQTDRQQCVSYQSMHGIPDAGAQTLDMSIETTLMDDTYRELASPWNITIRFTCSNPVEGMYEWGHIENISASVVGFSSWPSGFENAGTMYFRIVNKQTSTNRTPINADFIPVDGSTIQIEGGQIMARGSVEMPALAPSAIYLYGQDGNTYEITVDSTGTLKATRYQN